MKSLLIILVFCFTSVLRSQTDLIIYTSACYNYDGDFIMESLKVYKEDSLIKVFEISKPRLFYWNGPFSVLFVHFTGCTRLVEACNPVYEVCKAEPKSLLTKAFVLE